MEEFVFICMGGRYTKFGTKGRGTPSALSDEEFNSIIPTVLAYNPEENRFLIGKEAVQYRSIDPANTIWNLPALLYPPLADEFVQRASESAAFKIEVDEDRECSVCFDDNWYSVKEIVRYYIVELKHTIEKSLNKAFEKAVFTVPHGATVNHRKALVEAAENAGFTTVRLITEPMAAVVGSEYPHTDDGVLCNVYLGFSTAGVSVVEKEEGAYEQIARFGEVQPGLWKGDLEIARILADSLQGNSNVHFTV
ncbi:MAG: Hsp70 family protein, partial [Spirochaetota bacterium]